METGLAFVSSVEFEPQGTAHFHFSAPIFSKGVKPIGVLRCLYSATVLQRLIAGSSGLLGPGSFAVLVDENGLRLAHGE